MRVLDPPQASRGAATLLVGRIRASAEVGRSPSVTAEFSAPGFTTRRLTADVINGRADFGRVVLRGVSSVTLAGVRYFRPPDPPDLGDATERRSGYVDFLVRSLSDSALVVDTIAVVGSRLRLTGCADSPGLHSYIFEIGGPVSRSKRDSAVALTIHGGAGEIDSAVAAAGSVEYLPCSDQARLTLRIVWPWVLAARETKRIRIVLPPVSPRPPARRPVHLDLDQWEVVALRISGSSGYTVQASVPTRSAK